MAATKAELANLEKLVKEHGYTLRYERGNFNSGHCIVNDRKVIIVSKYYKLKAKIDTLQDIVSQLQLHMANELTLNPVDKSAKSLEEAA